MTTLKNSLRGCTSKKYFVYLSFTQLKGLNEEGDVSVCSCMHLCVHLCVFSEYVD